MPNFQFIIEVLGAILVIVSGYMILKNRLLEVRHKMPVSKKVSAKYFRKYKIFATAVRSTLFFCCIGSTGVGLLLVAEILGFNYGANEFANAAFWAIRLAGLCEMWMGVWILASSIGYPNEDFFTSVKDAMGSGINQIIIVLLELIILVAPITHLSVLFALWLKWLLSPTGGSLLGPLPF